MFDTRNFATMGLYPGLVSLRSIANLGHLEVEIIIEPEFPSLGGGGGAFIQRPAQPKYILKIRVSRKGKSWDYETRLKHSTAKVIAKFLGKELPTVEFISSNQIPIESPNVEVTHVSTTKIRRSRET